jgi:hypothetical protein
MDDIVKAAMAKWPNVPHTYGWLALDARGDWYLRDDQAQAAGPFPRIKGSRIEHEKLREFIERNYLSDEGGHWYFQNGPQRVYVELEAAPWVWRVDDDGMLRSHTGQAARLQSCWLDEDGRLFIETDLGFGIVHTQDVERASRHIDSGAWTPQHAAFRTLVQRYGFVMTPAKPG